MKLFVENNWEEADVVVRPCLVTHGPAELVPEEDLSSWVDEQSNGFQIVFVVVGEFAGYHDWRVAEFILFVYLVFGYSFVFEEFFEKVELLSEYYSMKRVIFHGRKRFSKLLFFA